MEEELRQAHKMESVGTLAGGIAHDFNNILGNTELVINDMDPESPSGPNLAEIRKAGLRAKELVRQLLNFSRKSEQAKGTVDIVAVIQASLDFLGTTTSSAIHIKSRLPDSPVPVLANAAQIRQVILNLCTNGVQAMEAEGGVLTVGLETVDAQEAVKMADIEPDATQYACLEVSDTGAGISHRIMDRIFDPYFTTRELDKGSGMGLAIVHDIIMNHHGAVRVDSRPGRGTGIRVLLPLHSEKIPA